MKLDLATNLIHDNEPCFGLAEINRMTTISGGGAHRFQIVEVIRNDKVVIFEEDMGPSSDYKTEEFVFPGHVTLGGGRYEVIENVGRLRGEANNFRTLVDGPHQRQQEPEDLVGGFEAFATKRRDARVGRIHFAT